MTVLAVTWLAVLLTPVVWLCNSRKARKAARYRLRISWIETEYAAPVAVDIVDRISMPSSFSAPCPVSASREMRVQ